jgi:serine/threonine protein kinase
VSAVAVAASAAGGGAAPSREQLAASLVGSHIDGFLVESVLGAGSFATVYRAKQVGLERMIALKVPTHEIAMDPVMAKRFAREARSAAKVHHPGVVTIYAVGELEDERPYIAMELVDGQSLERALDDGPLAPVRALKIIRLVASALSDTHAADVIHRDLKPSNIVWRVDRNGDDRITLVDFGIAVSKPGTADATRLTANGLIGTPHYMSPEQANGESVDARADLYALGVVLFELVTQATPFDGSGYEVLLAHLGRPAPPPSSVNPDVPTPVDDLVLKLLAKRRESRPQTADELVVHIDRAIAILEGRPPPPEPPKRPSATAELRAKTDIQNNETVRVGSGRRPQTSPSAGNTIESLALDATAPRLMTRAASAAETNDAVDSDESSAQTGNRATEGDVLAARAAAIAMLDDHAGASMVLRPAPSRARWFALGSLISLGLATGGFFTYRTFFAPTPVRVDDTPAETQRREVLVESGEARLRVWIPTPLTAARSARFRLELRNKLGELLKPDQLVVTVEDPSGKAIGLAAFPRSSDPDQFGFGHTFAVSGRYKLRVFPPDTSTAFELALDVR